MKGDLDMRCLADFLFELFIILGKIGIMMVLQFLRGAL